MNAKKALSSMLAGCLFLTLGTTTFAGTLYSSSSKSLAAGKTWSSYLYDPGNHSDVGLTVTIPSGGFACLLGANSTSGTRYELMGDKNSGSSDKTYNFYSFTSMIGGNKYFGVRLKNSTTKSITFKNITLESHGNGTWF